tara:strand:- start:1398 stop:1835 length:438 start_codon:yes stop_codon:yes gene_type:complete
MAGNDEQNRWLGRVVEQLRAIDGVEDKSLEDGRIAFTLSYKGARRKLVVADSAGTSVNVSASDYRALKSQYARICEALTELGVEEGMTLEAPRRSGGRPVSPEMIAARAKQQQEHDSWQELWRVIRKAEKALDVEFEIAQMQDYY